MKKNIIIIVVVVINLVLILVTANSVIKAVKDVLETGGVSDTVEGTSEEIIEENDEDENEEQIVQGIEPTVTVQSKLVNGEETFVIDAEDDENIKTVSIIHNGGEKQTIDVNDKTYHKEIIMTEGEINTIIVTVTNIDGLEKTKRVKFDNK